MTTMLKTTCVYCQNSIEWFPKPDATSTCTYCHVEYKRTELEAIWRVSYIKRFKELQDSLTVHPADLYFYKARIIRIIDGDTVEAIIDLGFNISITEKFRFAGFDAGETTWRAENDAEKVHGEMATSLVTNLILDKEVILITEKSGKYGRWIADIIIGGDLQNPVTLTDLMKEHGLEKRESYTPTSE